MATYRTRHVEEAAFVSPHRTSYAIEADREETEAYRPAERPSEADANDLEHEALREPKPAEVPGATGSADRGSAVASLPAQHRVEPEPDSEAAMPPYAESPETSANPAADLEQDEPAANTATDTEQASLYIPRSAMPPPLLGSLASLERQNERLEAEGLERIEDESDLEARIAEGVLVPLLASDSLTVNADLPSEHRYCRPWTARFLADLARAHEALFQKPIEVSSAVRTVEYQRRLMETNGNAAPAEGDIVSPHLTGATVDIAKKGMSRDEIAWMRRRLLALQDAGKIDVEEEFHQACFHITVYESYAPPKTLRRPSKAASPANRPRHQPEHAPASTEAATAGF